MRLVLENFRCFVERQEAEIRPLTLLVGENSSDAEFQPVNVREHCR